MARSASVRSARWLFVVEAVLVCVVAAVAFMLLDGTTGRDVAIRGLIAAGIGVVIGIVAWVIVAALDGRVRSARDLERASSSMVLAEVPRHPLDAVRPDGVAMLSDPNSIEAEGFRQLFAGVEHALQAADAVTVLITSPRPGEGKTSVAVNLAAAAAKAGRRVVLIDGDLRRPQVHRLLEVTGRAGLVDILRGEGKVGDLMQRLGEQRNLAVLSAGQPPPDPAELLASERLGRLFESLSEASDIVVIDAPPLLPVSDAMQIARHADATVLVGTAGISRRSEWKRAVRQLAVVGANVVGTALMMPDTRVYVRAVSPYAPSAPPSNWWVTADAGAPRVPATSTTVGDDEWPWDGAGRVRQALSNRPATQPSPPVAAAADVDTDSDEPDGDATADAWPFPGDPLLQSQRSGSSEEPPADALDATEALQIDETFNWRLPPRTEIDTPQQEHFEWPERGDGTPESGSSMP